MKHNSVPLVLNRALCISIPVPNTHHLHTRTAMSPQAMVKHNSVPLVLKRELPSRFGLLRRDAASSPDGGSPVQWFELKVVGTAVGTWEGVPLGGFPVQWFKLGSQGGWRQG